MSSIVNSMIAPKGFAKLRHRYDQPQALESLVRELYGTDFGDAPTWRFVSGEAVRQSGPLPALVRQLLSRRAWKRLRSPLPHDASLSGRLGDPMLLPLRDRWLKQPASPQILKIPTGCKPWPWHGCKQRRPEACCQEHAGQLARSWELGRYRCVMGPGKPRPQKPPPERA